MKKVNGNILTENYRKLLRQLLIDVDDDQREYQIPFFEAKKKRK